MGRWAVPSRRHARKAVRAGADGALDVLHPLLVLGRGACRLAAKSRNWWLDTPRERRGPTLFALAACGVLLWLLPYGPVLAGCALLGSTAWYGRRQAGPTPPRAAPTAPQRARLQALYEALVPYFAPPGGAPGEPLYAPDGGWERAFEEEFAFRDGRISGLLLRYPTSFRDSEPAERLRLEHLLAAKTGRGREYRFCWDEECNLLEMTALEPLPGGIRAQPFGTAPDETVLGFTDGDETGRTVPVRFPGENRDDDVAAVVWRTGPRSTEPHLLAVGTPGAGTSTLLRAHSPSRHSAAARCCWWTATGAASSPPSRRGAECWERSPPCRGHSPRWSGRRARRNAGCWPRAARGSTVRTPRERRPGRCACWWTGPPSSAISPAPGAWPTRRSCCGPRCATAAPRGARGGRRAVRRPGRAGRSSPRLHPRPGGAGRRHPRTGGRGAGQGAADGTGRRGAAGPGLRPARRRPGAAAPGARDPRPAGRDRGRGRADRRPGPAPGIGAYPRAGTGGGPRVRRPAGARRRGAAPARRSPPLAQDGRAGPPTGRQAT
ncbi:hypothetical protein IHE61_18305 [Streptomyces sp. GKU 257-1]|nr:hypothetical protein [Streptomyces sp. GKU 257-1]